jgi:hypothetical protein
MSRSSSPLPNFDAPAMKIQPELKREIQHDLAVDVRDENIEQNQQNFNNDNVQPPILTEEAPAQAPLIGPWSTKAALKYTAFALFTNSASMVIAKTIFESVAHTVGRDGDEHIKDDPNYWVKATEILAGSFIAHGLRAIATKGFKWEGLAPQNIPRPLQVCTIVATAFLSGSSYIQNGVSATFSHISGVGSLVAGVITTAPLMMVQDGVNVAAIKTKRLIADKWQRRAITIVDNLPPPAPMAEAMESNLAQAAASSPIATQPTSNTTPLLAKATPSNASTIARIGLLRQPSATEPTIQISQSCCVILANR